MARSRYDDNGIDQNVHEAGIKLAEILKDNNQAIELIYNHVALAHQNTLEEFANNNEDRLKAILSHIPNEDKNAFAAFQALDDASAESAAEYLKDKPLASSPLLKAANNYAPSTHVTPTAPNYAAMPSNDIYGPIAPLSSGVNSEYVPIPKPPEPTSRDNIYVAVPSLANIEKQEIILAVEDLCISITDDSGTAKISKQLLSHIINECMPPGAAFNEKKFNEHQKDIVEQLNHLRTQDTNHSIDEITSRINALHTDYLTKFKNQLAEIHQNLPDKSSNEELNTVDKKLSSLIAACQNTKSVYEHQEDIAGVLTQIRHLTNDPEMDKRLNRAAIDMGNVIDSHAKNVQIEATNKPQVPAPNKPEVQSKSTPIQSNNQIKAKYDAEIAALESTRDQYKRFIAGNNLDKKQKQDAEKKLKQMDGQIELLKMLPYSPPLKEQVGQLQRNMLKGDSGNDQLDDIQKQFNDQITGVIDFVKNNDFNYRTVIVREFPYDSNKSPEENVKAHLSELHIGVDVDRDASLKSPQSIHVASSQFDSGTVRVSTMETDYGTAAFSEVVRASGSSSYANLPKELSFQGIFEKTCKELPESIDSVGKGFRAHLLRLGPEIHRRMQARTVDFNMGGKVESLESIILDVLKNEGLDKYAKNSKMMAANISKEFLKIHDKANLQPTKVDGFQFASNDLIKFTANQINSFAALNPGQPIIINNPPSAEYLKTAMLYAKAHNITIINNSGYKKIDFPPDKEVRAFQSLLYKNHLDYGGLQTKTHKEVAELLPASGRKPK